MTELAKEKKMVPELRFSGFSGDWPVEKLDRYFIFKNGVNADKSQYGSGRKFINVLDIIKKGPIFHDCIIGAVDISDKEFKKNEVVYGDILFQRSSEIREEAGQSNVYLDKNSSATFGGFVIRGRPIKSFNPLYFDFLLKTQASRKEITTKAGGSTRFNVGQDSLGDVVLNICQSEKEQKKIASFLTSVDDKLNLLRRKRDALQIYKRGVMQKIFSQEIRFTQDDGTVFDDWKDKRIEDATTKVTSSISANSLEGNSGCYSMYGASGLLKTVNFYTEEEPYISIVKDGAGVGRIFLCEAKSSVLGTLDIIKPVKGNNLVFIYYLLGKIRYSKYITGSTIPHIYYRDYLKEKISVPCLEEQQKIANFLSAIDKKIDQVNQQITQTDTFKKGLLQKMFV